MTNMSIFLSVLITALVTLLLRLLPFVFFRGNRATPSIIIYMGKYLPYAIMAMLVVYCFKEVSPLSYPYGIPELLSAAVVVLVHILKRNTLFSIAFGTVLYMLLVQFVF